MPSSASLGFKQYSLRRTRLAMPLRATNGFGDWGLLVPLGWSEGPQPVRGDHSDGVQRGP